MRTEYSTSKRSTSEGTKLKPTRSAFVVYSLLLAVTIASLIIHRATGYDYPALPSFSYELNVLGDLYEAFLLVPVGLVGLWAMSRGRVWGTLLAAAVGTHTVYNYAMAATGIQNAWIFGWAARAALGGATVALLWPTLAPATEGRPCGGRLAITAYLALAGLGIGAMMWRRLAASAAGIAIGMSGVSSGAVNWADPTLRDPIVFFTLVVPFLVSAVIGLAGDREWGRNSAALCLVFIPTIVSVILFTGPLKEYLETGAVSGAVWGLSVILTVIAAVAVVSLVWLFRRPRPLAGKARGAGGGGRRN